MNAKITITVPIEKLNIKVSNMLEEIAQELENCSIDVTAVSNAVKSEHDLLLQLETIDSLRKKMALLDANLEDCYSITNGLLNYRSNKLKMINQKEQENVAE